MYYVIDIDTDTGKLVAEFKRLDNSFRERILEYVEAYAGIMKKGWLINTITNINIEN